MRQKMRILLVTVAIFVNIEAKAENWENVFNSAFGRSERGNNDGQGSSWVNPLRPDYLQNIALSSNVEWVCRNSKTNDMMIIASDNIQQTPNRGPWLHWQNFLPNYHTHPQVYYWPQPIIAVQGTKDGGNENGNQMSSSNKSPETHNNDNQPQTKPQYHGGEGLIDIRFGRNDS